MLWGVRAYGYVEVVNVGLLYQWGRKDCFPGADGSTIQNNGNATTIQIYGADGSTLTENTTKGLQIIEITTEGIMDENNSQIYSIKHPLTVIYNPTVPWDWYTNSNNHNNILWGDANTKSDYDPCPNGWHIPTNGTWGDFSLTTFPYYIQGSQSSSGNPNVTNGRLYNQISWFPAGGRRRSTLGTLGNAGNYGYTWSNTVVDDNCSYTLLFDVSSLEPSYVYSRAGGFPIRCIQE